MIRVTCAIIFHEQKILVTQRGPFMKHPSKWEFPGGKIEAGENEEACIHREIYEELNITIEIKHRMVSVLHAYDSVQIELIPFIAEFKHGVITLREHMHYKWLPLEELNNLDWVAADVKVVGDLIAFMNSNYNTT